MTKARVADWYPLTDGERITWHRNFAQMCAESGASFGLSAAEIAQAEADAELVLAVINSIVQTRAYYQALAEFKRQVLQGSSTAQMPDAPTAPAGVSVPMGALPGIMRRTRRLAGFLRVQKGFSRAQQERFGIASPEAGPCGRPSVTAFSEPRGIVRLRLLMAGYRFLAVDCRVAGGAWEQIGLAMRRVYMDRRAPSGGVPEVREYRVQGFVANGRVGENSDAASCVTLP
ncbi:MAG: hypothetical protein M3O61_17940 [Gemmatimonadota bacterium]|nr:hypothetical protein [Gemmatimonadota bacterium]